MADYEREQQNNDLLNSLSSKVSALKHVTIDIYDNARDQDSLDHSVRYACLPLFSHFAAYAYTYTDGGPINLGLDPTLPSPNIPITLTFNQVFSSLSTNLKGSANRLTRMARQGDTVAVLKVAGIVIGAGVLIWLILGWIF
ncbi:hypothetical protein BJX62DRAFT_242106 [Aspergillus germanicus]